MGPLGFSVRLQRPSNSSNSSNQHGRNGGYHRGLGALTRLSGSAGSRVAATSVARNVPRPVQTSSLKKENGGQDVTAVLVNRNNGKKIGWGSALPTKAPAAPAPNPSEPTPAETSSIVAAGKQQSQTNSDQQPSSTLSQLQQPPPLPPPPTANSKNVPWALHPPTNLPLPVTSNSSVAPPQGPTRPGEHGPPPRHQHQEHGEQSLQQDKNSYHNQSYDHHDFRDRHDPHAHPNDHNGTYGKDDRFSHQHLDSRRPHQHYRPRSDSYDRSYSRSYDARVDYRDRDFHDRDGHRAAKDYYRYDHRDRDKFDNRGWYDRDRGPSPHYDRSHSPNHYPRGRHPRAEDRRWADNDYRFSHRGSYGLDYRDAPRHIGQVGPGHPDDNLNERGQNHDPRGFGVEGREELIHERNRREGLGTFSGSHNHPHPHSWTHPGSPDERARLLIPPRSDYLHQSLPKSEEDIIMQAVREREAAEARAHTQKEMEEQTRGKEQNSETSRSISNEPITILRNKQASGEASGDTALTEEPQTGDNRYQLQTGLSEKLRQESVGVASQKSENVIIEKSTNIVLKGKIGNRKDQTTSDILEQQQTTEQLHEEQSQKYADTLEKDIDSKDILPAEKFDVRETEQKEEKDERSRHGQVLEQQQNVLRHAAANTTRSKSRSRSRSNTKNERVFEEQNQTQQPNATMQEPMVGSKEMLPTKAPDTGKSGEEENKALDQQQNVLRHVATRRNGKNAVLSKETLLSKTPNTEKIDEEEEKDEKQSKHDQALEQQQNVLRHVATRRHGKNARTHLQSRKNESSNRQTRQNTSSSVTEEDTMPSHMQKADRDELNKEREKAEAEARAARAEHRRTRGPRTKGVLFRRLPDGTIVNADLSEEEIARREQRRKAREETIKAKEERMKAKEERARLSASKEKKSGAKPLEKTSQATIATPSKPKPFVPAPPPAVSAWKAGPPPGFIKASNPSSPRPDEAPSKLSSLQKGVVEEYIAGGNEQDSSALTSTRTAEESFPNEEVSIQFGNIEKRDANWNEPHVGSDGTQQKNQSSNASKFTPMNPIALPMSGVATWNTFGSPNLFAPPQENSSVSADWSLRQDSSRNNSVGKTLPWSEAHSAPVADHPSIDDDDVALTDASAAVPRDLLSSAPGSEDENHAPNEEDVTKEETSNRSLNRRKGQKNSDKRSTKSRNKSALSSSAKRKKKYPPKQNTNASDASSFSENKKEVNTSEARGKRFSRKPRGPKKQGSDGEVHLKEASFSSRSKKFSNRGQQREQNATEDRPSKKRQRRPTQRNKNTRKPQAQETSETN